MKYFFLPWLIIVSIVANAQDKLSTTRSIDHINIAGTQIWMDAPEGFEKATNFLGLQQVASGASMMILQIPEKFKVLAEGFTPEAMKKKGMVFKSKETFFINSKEAILIASEQFSPAHGYNFLKYSLILSTANDSSVLINANIPEARKDQLLPAIRSSLLSLYVDKSTVVDEFSSLDFSIDYKGTKFKLQKSVSGTLVFAGPGESMLIIAKSVRALDNNDKKGSSIVALKAITQITYESLISSGEAKVDDANAYEISANVTIAGKKATALQTILFGDNYYYDFLLVMPLDQPGIRTDYYLLLKSFKRK